MEIFSEVYNSYYQMMKRILQSHASVSIEDLRLVVGEQGYEESLLYLIPKITSGEWDLFDKDGTLFVSKLSEDFYVPLTDLQKAYVKTILSDSKMRLFLDQEEVERVISYLEGVPLLWKEEDYCYYDRYSNRDPYEDANYVANFRTILQAIRNKQYVDILYESREGKRVHHHYLPCRLEYSVRNDKFRLLGVMKGRKRQQEDAWNTKGHQRQQGDVWNTKECQRQQGDALDTKEWQHQQRDALDTKEWQHQQRDVLDMNGKQSCEGGVSDMQYVQVDTLNLGRMQQVSPLDVYADELPDIDACIKAGYYKEPVRLLIHTDRNALERAMLQFANYEKNTTKIDDNTYECVIQYNTNNETELLIEVLSFGPMIEVLGNEHFLEQLKTRLKKQKKLFDGL